VRDVLRALQSGIQEDHAAENRRQFMLGHAAGVLGLVRFYDLLVTAQQR
jgi:hypothetical protein